MGDAGTSLNNHTRLMPEGTCMAQAVPAEKAVRELLRTLASEHVKRERIVPPLTLEELRSHAEEVIRRAKCTRAYLDFTTVLVGNETWTETFSSIPYERRVLLLPQCLRQRSKCPAKMDEVGLLCQECGRCPIGTFQAAAESLGYLVLVAEGTIVVTRLLEQGHVDAVVGVSCLHTLERAFPHAAAHAIPGIAIPLYRDGCDATGVDEEWVLAAIQAKAQTKWPGRVDIDEIRNEVDSWFEAEALRDVLGSTATFTDEQALAWLAQAGKRWRPVLAACVFQTLAGDSDQGAMPKALRMVAMATECFHKASLIHDDIEDGDEVRYGQPTPAKRHGVPIALNLGDLLIGEGYRLISESGLSAQQQARMLRVAAEGHRTLCLGQGAELCWLREPTGLTTTQVLEIFRQKTSPAFEVALRLGAICAGADEELEQSLKRFSAALGVAFQIRDDLDDAFSDEGDRAPSGASIIASLACEHGDKTLRDRLKKGLHPENHVDAQLALLREVSASLKIEEKARQLLEHHRNEAIRSLGDLKNAHLKGLLRRLVGRVLGAPPQ